MSGAANGDEKSEMRVDPARAKQLVENLSSVCKRVDAGRNGRKVRLIAVSKLKPASDILALHQDQQQSSPRHVHFGENYAQELTTKASLLPRSVRWHMIGALQTNKCKPLAEAVPNLYCVSSVDTAKKADALEKGRAAMLEKSKQEESKDADREDQDGVAEEDDKDDRRLRVLVQVNTSGEESKSGVEPGADAVALCRHVREECPHLRLAGLMTIGDIARSQSSATNEEGGENEDFSKLKETRELVAKELGLDKESLELSMGMSADFELAIRQGSDEVRVGTGIFGERPRKEDARIT